MTTSEGYYSAGDYYLLCDECGFKRRRSECAKRWDGAMVCADTCYEQRHPLDTPPPARPERQSVLDARESEATEVANIPGWVEPDWVDPDWVI